MKDYKIFKKQLFKKPAVKKAYDNLKTEYTLIEMIIAKRIQQGLTQKQLAKKIGIKQPIISRLECGSYNPSIKFLHRIADALEADLNISIM